MANHPHGYDPMQSTISTPNLIEADFRRGVPFATVFPEVTASFKRQGGRPRLKRLKVKVTWRPAVNVVDAVNTAGKGYNAHVEIILRDAIINRLSCN